MTVSEVKKKYSGVLRAIPGVTGLGVGEGLRIYVKDQESLVVLKEILAKKIEGVKVEFICGEIRASGQRG